MLIHECNNYSWYPLNFHHYVDDDSLYRVEVTEGVELRYDLKNGKPIVIRVNNIETEPTQKTEKIEKLKEVFGRTKYTQKESVDRFVKDNLVEIESIVL